MDHPTIHVPIHESSKNRLNAIGIGILTNLEIFWKDTHTHCVVQGDTSTALFAALFVFHRHCKIIHIEAGLRTYDLTQPYPEEANRQMISRIANYHFTPHESSRNLLLNEKISTPIYTVGNTILDLIKSYKLTPTLTDNVLITFHRRENWDKLPVFIESLKTLIKKYPNLHFTWCMHPNPSLQKSILDSFANTNSSSLTLSNPLPHKELTAYLAKAKFIITDSGGLQEEASFLGKTTIVLRESTERDAIPQPYIYLCKDILTLTSLIDSLDFQIHPPCTVYGDGTSSQQILNLLKLTDNLA